MSSLYLVQNPLGWCETTGFSGFVIPWIKESEPRHRLARHSLPEEERISGKWGRQCESKIKIRETAGPALVLARKGAEERAMANRAEVLW